MFQKNVLEKLKTHVLISVTFFPENLAVYEMMWSDKPQMTVQGC